MYMVTYYLSISIKNWGENCSRCNINFRPLLHIIHPMYICSSQIIKLLVKTLSTQHVFVGVDVYSIHWQSWVINMPALLNVHSAWRVGKFSLVCSWLGLIPGPWIVSKMVSMTTKCLSCCILQFVSFPCSILELSCLHSFVLLKIVETVLKLCCAHYASILWLFAKNLIFLKILQIVDCKR